MRYTILLIPILSLAACATTVAPDEEGPGVTGKSDGASNLLFAEVDMIVSVAGYRCPCHPDVSFRAVLSEDAEIRSEYIGAVLSDDHGDSVRLSLVLDSATGEYGSEMIAISDWDAGGQFNQLKLQLLPDGFEPARYTFDRGLVGEVIPGGFEANAPESVEPAEPTVTRFFAETVGSPDQEAHSVRLHMRAEVVGVRPDFGARLAFELWVRDPDGGDWISWGTFQLDSNGTDFERTFDFFQDPGDPDPTGRMLVRVDAFEYYGEAIAGAHEFLMVDGFPEASTPLAED